MAARLAGKPAGETPPAVEISGRVRPLVMASAPVDDVDDVMQDVRWEVLKTFAPGSGRHADKDGAERTAIVLGIAKHKCADVHRKRLRQQRLIERCVPDVAHGSDLYDAVGGTPLEAWDEVQRWADLARGPLDDLSDDEHEALMLKCAHNLTYDQVALELGLRRSTAQDRVERALKKVRAAIATLDIICNL